MADSLARQLADELGAVAGSLAPFAPDLGLEIERRIVGAAPMLAAQLRSVDDHLVAQTVIDVMTALWPRSDPAPEWWRTPLGQACATSFGVDDAEAVTWSVAAAMLGVTKGTVSQLMARGKLDRHPDGGILRASVLQRLARR